MKKSKIANAVPKRWTVEYRHNDVDNDEARHVNREPTYSSRMLPARSGLVWD